jgi:uncharacterized protein YbbK (DUF523 family)
LSVKEKLLVSACLLGENVKYNGKNNKIEEIEGLSKKYELIPFCPEVEGGLPTPRPPSEIVSLNPLKIKNINGNDVTDFFTKGAVKAFDLCQKLDIKKALLKENSPSCGKKQIYDGTFSKTLKRGEGVASSLLGKNGIEIFNENEVSILMKKAF